MKYHLISKYRSALAGLFLIAACGDASQSTPLPIDAARPMETFPPPLCNDSKPIPLAHRNAPASIAVDSTNVYWTTDDGEVLKTSIVGGDTTVLAIEQSSPTGIAVDATHVYWVNSRPFGEIMSVPITGGTPIVFADKQRRPFALAVANDVVYWTNNDDGTVMSLPVTGGTPTQIADRQGALTGIAVDNNTLYWASIGQHAIRANTIGQNTIRTIAPSQEAIALFARDTKAYWVDVQLNNADTASSVFSVTGAGDLATLAMSPSPFAAVADNQYVYWSDVSACVILRVSIEGGALCTFASQQPGASMLAIDDANLYWLNLVSGTVMKQEKRF